MLEIKISVAESIAQKINNIKPDAEIKATEIASMLEYPPDAKMGDLALPCFKMSKTLRMSPVKIAEAVADSFENAYVDRAEAVNGYLNIFLDGQKISEKVVVEVLDRGEKYGAPDFGKGKTVVLD